MHFYPGKPTAWSCTLDRLWNSILGDFFAALGLWFTAYCARYRTGLGSMSQGPGHKASGIRALQHPSLRVGVDSGHKLTLRSQASCGYGLLARSQQSKEQSEKEQVVRNEGCWADAVSSSLSKQHSRSAPKAFPNRSHTVALKVCVCLFPQP